MTHPAPAHFLPAPPDRRCSAIIYRIPWTFTGQRCPQRHVAGSDLCARHRDMEAQGRTVLRVKAPRTVR